MSLQISKWRGGGQDNRRLYFVTGEAMDCARCGKNIATGTLVTKGVSGDSWAPVCRICRPFELVASGLKSGTPAVGEASTFCVDEAGPESAPSGSLDVWAIVEIMGHQKIAGKISEQSIAGTNMLRVDVPAVGDEHAFTQFLAGHALYRITPVAEDVAIAAATKIKKDPIVVWGVRDGLEEGKTALRLPDEHDPSDYEPPDPEPEDYGPLDEFGRC